MPIAFWKKLCQTTAANLAVQVQTTDTFTVSRVFHRSSRHASLFFVLLSKSLIPNARILCVLPHKIDAVEYAMSCCFVVVQAVTLEFDQERENKVRQILSVFDAHVKEFAQCLMNFYTYSEQRSKEFPVNSEREPISAENRKVCGETG